MSSPNESNLGIRVTSTGVDESLQKLRQLHDELNRGTITTKEYRTEAREQNTLLNSNTKLWNESKAAIFAANPTLLEFSRTMSGFGQITAAATSGMTAINTAMLLLAGGSDSINQVKIKIAELTNQLDNLEAAGQGGTTQAQNLRNTIAQLHTELGNLNNQFAVQQIEAALSFGAALGQMAVGGQGAIITLKTLSTFLGEKSFFSSNIAGILGTTGALTAVAIAALVAGTALGEAFNPNKQAVADFRAQLDASFGDNPFTNYVILPIAAMIDDLNGAKADWNKDVRDMGRVWSDFTFQAQTDWVNFENTIIGGLNTINHARNTIFGGLDKLRGVASPADTPLIPLPLQNNPNADSVNKLLIGNPITHPEQKQQLQLSSEQNRILEQTKSFGQALTATIQSNTNPLLSQSNTTLTGIYQSSQDANQLAHQQLQATQEQKAAQVTIQTAIQQGISSQTQKLADLQKQLEDAKKNLSIASLTHADALNNSPNFTASDFPDIIGAINNINAIDSQISGTKQNIAQLQSRGTILDNATSGLAPILSGLGLSSDTGIGSIIAGALGGAAGIGGAGINQDQIAEFVRNHNFGVFTKAAIADNEIRPPTQREQIRSLQEALDKMGFSGAETTLAAARRALGFDGPLSNGSRSVGSFTPGSPIGFAGLPGQFGVPSTPASRLGDNFLIPDPNHPRTRQIKAATGFEGMVTGPTHFLAGEAGPEFIHISPTGKSSGNTNITVNVYPQGSVIALNELDNVIQESLKQTLKRAGFT